MIIIFAQNVLILLLMRWFAKESIEGSVLIVGAISVFTFTCLSIPLRYCDYLVLYAVICNLISRVPQILANFQNKHTGVLSVIVR